MLANKALSASVTANPDAWDITKFVYDAQSKAWDISTLTYFQSFSVSTQETVPQDLFFKPDGTKMYVIGSTGDDVNEYSLSTAWDISTASYVQNFSVATQETTPTGLFFKPDGTKMYVVGNTGDDVNEYSLSTAWDISTASYVQNFSVATQETGPTGLFFKPDGTKMYVTGSFGDDVNEYSLSIAWDVNSASYVQNFSVATQETVPQGLFFKPDGTKMYIVGTAGQDINEYSLSTAWDISTASYVQNFAVSPLDSGPQGLFFKPDGSMFYFVGAINESVYQYTLGGFSVATQDTSPQGLFFKPDGTKMYVIGNSGNDVNEYSLSIAWDINSASYVQNFSVATQETVPTGLFFKPDGTKMYVVGSNSDNVNEYSLSTAWDISTASYVQNFSVASEDTSPQGLFFKPDGTKMYVVGAIGDDVNEYSLSTAWNISTASYVQNFSVATQEIGPQDLFFKPDGTKMYVVGSTGDNVNEYSLSTAWDISTASYTAALKMVFPVPTGIFMRDDGLQLFVVDSSSDIVYSFSID
jgi:DNA-binding beta-propeller fold protein YncE